MSHKCSVMSHKCHAAGCSVSVPPEYLMCYRHWNMVPIRLRMKVWSTYRQGQCDDWQPSAEYCDAAKEAVLSVARLEGRTLAPDDPAIALYDFFKPKEKKVEKEGNHHV